MTTRFPAATAALERLAATPTTCPEHLPRLAVTSRHAQTGGDIHADPTAHWWSCGERIGPITDLPATARKISSALQPIPVPYP